MKDREPKSYEERTFNLPPSAIDNISKAIKRHKLKNKEVVIRALALQRAVNEIQASGGVIWVSSPGEVDELFEDIPEYRSLIGSEKSNDVAVILIQEQAEDFSDPGINIIPFRQRR